MFATTLSPSAPTKDGGLSFDDVRVLKQEAVGMYQVAVLEAGSPEALSRWMKTHGYVYPDGMDAVVQDYVDKTWCFVAVKARVGQKRGVTPRPGMKSTKPDLPDGAEFSGAVQAMGFRFRVEAPVVPMRLSAYNPGRLHNIVYALCESGIRVKELPRSFVKRVVPGPELLANLTEPLPARFTWRGSGRDRGGQPVRNRTLEVRRGEAPDLPESVRKIANLEDIARRRDPVPFSGKARDLFASDLLAVRRARLSHAFEEAQKDLLNIGEELGLRGPELDALIEKEIEDLRRDATRDVLADLESMTLTVIEGDFPRETLKRTDLTFLATITPGTLEERGRSGYGPLFAALLAVALAVLVAASLARRRSTAALVLLGAVLLVSPAAAPQDAPGADLIPGLSDPDLRAATMAKLERLGKAAVPALVDHIAREDADTVARGWAIVCVSRIRAASALRGLKRVCESAQSELVKTWALAAVARIDADLGRELCLRRLAALGWNRQNDAYRLLSRFATKTPGVNDPAGYIRTVLQGADNNVRRLAAGFLGSGAIDSPATRAAYIKALKYDASAKAPPWRGGALFVPGIPWTKAQARELTARLIHWMMWAETNERPQVRVVQNNLVSLAARTGLGRWNWKASGADWALIWTRLWWKQHRLEAGRLLVHVMRGGNARARGHARERLKEMAGKDHGATAEDWAQWLKILELDR